VGRDEVAYSVCVNQPGYLPEADPHYAATLHEARELAAAEVRFALGSLIEMDGDAAVAGMTAAEIDQVLMGAYDLGPDGGQLWLPGDQGYIVDVQPVW